MHTLLFLLARRESNLTIRHFCISLSSSCCLQCGGELCCRASTLSPHNCLPIICTTTQSQATYHELSCCLIQIRYPLSWSLLIPELALFLTKTKALCQINFAHYMGRQHGHYPCPTAASLFHKSGPVMFSSSSEAENQLLMRDETKQKRTPRTVSSNSPCSNYFLLSVRHSLCIDNPIYIGIYFLLESSTRLSTFFVPVRRSGEGHF